MLDELTPQQFDEWCAYFGLEPWGEDRADWRIGQLACALESLWSSSPSWTPWQFMLPHARPANFDDEDEQSAEDQAETWRLIAARYEDP